MWQVLLSTHFLNPFRGTILPKVVYENATLEEIPRQLHKLGTSYPTRLYLGHRLGSMSSVLLPYHKNVVRVANDCTARLTRLFLSTWSCHQPPSIVLSVRNRDQEAVGAVASTKSDCVTDLSPDVWHLPPIAV